VNLTERQDQVRGATVGAAISCSGLTKRFGETLAVSDLSFDVPFGAITGFIGANGSGKTTTMRMIAGLVRPSSGSIAIGGVPYEDLGRPRQMLGAALDRIGAHPGHSARLHLQTIARAAGIAPTRVEQVLETVELTADADRAIGTYSTGMTQRCALAAALLGEPAIVLLDEPANGLDPGGIRWLRTFLRTQADGGVAVLVSSHQLAELGAMVDRVVVLQRGVLVMSGPTGELFRLTGAHELEDAFLALTEGTQVSPS
jgi:ABC-2 type transport system ATP-binding protein